MTKVTVIDASVAIKWFVVEESKRLEALEVLDAIQKEPQGFAVPELFFNEMLAVLCKLLVDEREIHANIRLLEQLGLTRIGNGAEILEMAATIATKHKLTGYDAIYAATAKLLTGKWLTADSRAHKRIEAIRVSVLL